MYEFCVFAGTTEGRELTEALLDAGASVTACVATEYGQTLLGSHPKLTISARRLTEEEMEALLASRDFACVIDATHPYASAVTENIAAACEGAGRPYLRLLRGSQEGGDGAVSVPDAAAAAAYLSEQEGNVLLTTGSKELSLYTGMKGFAARTYARVLPMDASLAACREVGLEPSHIIAMQGPFSREMNAATLRAVDARFLVTKDTGRSGGFLEKLEAARDAGAVALVVGRPPQREGLEPEALLALLEERYGLRFRRRVTVAGIGPGSREQMTQEALRAVRQADCLIGASRMLELARPGQETFAAIQPEVIRDFLRRRRDLRRAVVVLSGDVGFFSAAKKLLPALAEFDCRVLPGLSSLSALCAQLGTSYEDVVPVSVHGRERDIVPDVLRNRRVFALVGGENGVSGLCRSLTEAGLGEVSVSVGERLSYPDQRITRGTARELAEGRFQSLSAVLIENSRADPLVSTGLPDAAFQRGADRTGSVVPMTKSEVRAVALAKLALRERSLCWDVGAGTGSVAIEMARLCRRGHVYAIERKEDALLLLEENRKKFRLSNLTAVAGAAPAACRDLPAPTHVFIGGSGGNLRDIIALALEKNPKVRIVAAAIALETAAELTACAKEFPFTYTETVSLTVARDRRAGPYRLMTGQNPVYLFTFGWEETV